MAETKSIEVVLRGEIGSGDRTYSAVLHRVEAAGELDEIEVRINSRGGNFEHAEKIFNFLFSHSATVATRIDATASGCTGLIAMVGEQITMPANTTIAPWDPWQGGDEDSMSAAELALVEIYKARTGLSVSALKDFFANNKLLSAIEAKKHRFIDEVISLKTNSSAAAVADICVNGGFAHLASDWIREGISASEAKNRIISLKRDQVGTSWQRAFSSQRIAPLETITKPTLSNREAAHFLNRAEPTLRGWASRGDGPIKPIKIHGALAWRTADVKKLLQVG